MSTAFLRFVEQPLAPRRKTADYVIENIQSHAMIGRIVFYPQWRQYVFVPRTNTIWNVDCLAEVHRKLQELKQQRRDSRSSVEPV